MSKILRICIRLFANSHPVKLTKSLNFNSKYHRCKQNTLKVITSKEDLRSQSRGFESLSFHLQGRSDQVKADLIYCPDYRTDNRSFLKI